MARTELLLSLRGKPAIYPRTLFARSLRDQAGNCTLSSPTVVTALHTAPAPAYGGR